MSDSDNKAESSVETDKTGARERRMTDKGVQYKADNLRKSLISAISKWRRYGKEIVILLTDSSDVKAIRSGRDNLSACDNEIHEIFFKLENLLQNSIPDMEFDQSDVFQKFENQQGQHLRLITRIADRITELNSLCEKSSLSSSRTPSSRSSKSSKKSVIAAEAAALEIKLKFMDATEKSKAQLEKLETVKDLAIAKAKLEVLNEYSDIQSCLDEAAALPTGNNDNYVEEYVKTLSLNPSADEFVPTCLPAMCNSDTAQVTTSNTVTQAPVQNTSVYLNTSPLSAPSIKVSDTNGIQNSNLNKDPLNVNDISPEQAQFELFAKTLADQVTLSRLPPPEPTVFYGDPLKYTEWKTTFHTLIEQRKIPPAERIHFLRKYIGGPVKDVLENLFVLSSDNAYDEAKTLLNERYGNPFIIAKAFRDKLEGWPKVNSRDSHALQKFGDFLKHCLSAMNSIGNLSILNDSRENKKMLSKLPDWIVTRWGRIATKHVNENGGYPSFEYFVNFITSEAKIACNPITSLNSLKEVRDTYNSSSRVPGKAYVPSKGRSLSTQSTTESDFETNGENRHERQRCLFCNETHHLDKCRKFNAKPVEERKQFVRDKKLCFGCLYTGHVSKKCRKRMRCAVCSNLHPTSLHGDTRGQPKNNKSDLPQKLDNVSAENFSNASESSVLNPQPKNVSSGATSLTSSRNACKSTMVVPVYVSHVDNPSYERLVYALLDTQSDTTFVLDETCDALGVKGTIANLSLSTMYAENCLIESRRIKGLLVRGYNSELKFPLPDSFTRNIMPANRSHIPTPEMTLHWPHLKPITNHLMPLSDCEVGLLIGYNCARALIPRDVIPPIDNGPYGQRTDLGWGIVGIVDKKLCEDYDPIGLSHHIVKCDVPTAGSSTETREIIFSFRTSVKEVISPIEVNRMMEIEFNDRTFNDESLSMDDKKFMNLLNRDIRLSDGHYEMPLPFKDGVPSLPNNKLLAIHRVMHLKRRLLHDNCYKDHYFAFMENLIQNGFAEKVLECDMAHDDGHAWYIPHHGVYHPQKPSKIRVVFDCSAKYQNTCLNEHLLQGPDLTNSLIGVLCRFRKEPVAFVCDIEQMFHQFKVNREHRDYLRFLWWDNKDCNGQPSDYRMTVHLFGAASSPACANFGLKQIAVDNEMEFGLDVSNFVKRDFYVDDGLKSVSTVETAVDMIERTKGMLAKGGLRLHKFLSNSKEVLSRIPSGERAKVLDGVDLLVDKLPIERTLGVKWCVESDCFLFNFEPEKRQWSRRGMLSVLSSIYDPLGLLSPLILVGKQILQQACKDQTDWDSELSPQLLNRWERWCKDLEHIQSVRVKRCLKPEDFGEITLVELHHFSDASTGGYGQCSCIRLVNKDQKVHCSLVMAKSRVTPLKPVTIPRLELAAALVSVKMSSMLRRELQYESLKEYFWSDSNVALGYISNDARRFHTFVANRVQQIRENSDPWQWNYVNSKDNPADIASRGASVIELTENRKWFHGPNFLWENKVQTENNQEPSISPDDPEVRKVQSFDSKTNTVESTPSSILERLEYFSDWTCAKGAIALCLKLKNLLLKIPSKNCSEVDVLQSAEIEIIKHVQADAFPEILQMLSSIKGTQGRCMARNRKTLLKRTSSLYRLDPFLDSCGLMRVGGRLCRSTINESEKHPIILPRNSHITSLIVKHCHERIRHQGRGMTTNEIRETGFWIIGCSSVVSTFLRNCVTCRRLRGQNETQKMANLPTDRLQTVPPFTYSGVIYFGPWLIREGRRELKRYGVLFTCMSSRAIHLETANSLDTSSFINALRRFVAIRGPLRQLRSDRGTNFVGADRELREALRELDDEKLSHYLSKEGCDYIKFETNVPSASHMGGVWERQIRSVRNVLASLMYNIGSQLDDESLRTFMCEAAAIVNGRPLTTNNLNDPMSLEPLTPNHILTMKSKVILPPPGEFLKEDIYSRKRWRRVQYALNEFWTRWRKEFLQNLQTRNKWNSPKENLVKDDIVLVEDSNLPRNKWLLGRILNAEPDADGLVRKVSVTVGSSSNLDKRGKRLSELTVLERPIHKLVFLVRFPNEEPLE